MHFQIDSKTLNQFNFFLIQGLAHTPSSAAPHVLEFADVPANIAGSLEAELNAKSVPFKKSTGVNGAWTSVNGANWRS